MQVEDFYFAIAIEAAGIVSIQCILVLIDSVVYHITHMGYVRVLDILDDGSGLKEI
jgi:hypothetical protein